MLVFGLPGLGQQTEPEQLIQAGHWKRARMMVEARYRQAPDDALANFLLSQIRFAFGDHNSPLALAEKAVALSPRVAKYHRQLAEVLGIQAQHAGPVQQLFLARRFRKEIDTAIGLDARDAQALRDLMEFYLLAPAIAGGDARKAAEIAEQVEAIDAPEGLLAKARAALFQKRTEEAEARLREATRAQPPSYRARIELARFYLEAAPANREEAEKAARGGLDVDRSRVEGYNVLGAIYADRGQWAALESILQEAGEHNPDDRGPYYQAADHLLRSGREAARAERYLRAYLGQEPEGNEPRAAEAHWKLGLALEGQGRPMEAIAEWRESLRLDPASPAARDLKRLGSPRTTAYNAAAANRNRIMQARVQTVRDPQRKDQW